MPYSGGGFLFPLCRKRSFQDGVSVEDGREVDGGVKGAFLLGVWKMILASPGRLVNVGCEECPPDRSVVTNLTSEVLGDGLRSGDDSLRCVGLVLGVF